MITDGNERIQQSSRRVTVGVLIDSVSGYFNRRAIACLVDEADDRDIHLVFYFGGAFERGKDSGANSYAYALPDPAILDALIVFPHGIAPFNPSAIHEAILSRCDGTPVYSFFYPLPGAFSVIVEETQAITDMIDHIASEHRFRKIAVLAGPDSPESLSRARLDLITSLLQERGVTVDQDAIIQGDFTQESGVRAAKRLLSNAPSIPELLISLNDEMAIGAIREFLNNGITVPGDIAITGFDNVTDSVGNLTKLTSVGYPVWEMTSLVLDRITTDVTGKTSFAPDTNRFNARFIPRDSCGSLSHVPLIHPEPAVGPSMPNDTANQAQNGKIAELRKDLEDVLEECVARRETAPYIDFLQRTIKKLSRGGDLSSTYIDLFSTQWTLATLRHRDFEAQVFINSLFVDAFRIFLQIRTQFFARTHENDLGTINFTQNCNALIAKHLSVQETVRVIAANLPLLGIERCLLAFLRTDDPNMGELRLAYREGRASEVPEGDFPIFPARALAPDGIDSFRMPLAVLPLAQSSTVYGFMVFSMTTNHYEHFWRVQSLVSEIVAAAMANDLIENRIRSLTRTNDALSKLSVIDEFTGLYNRRALYAAGRSMFEKSRMDGEGCTFIFLDMDGLKRINDRFGHTEGDAAIQALAGILKRSFRDNDLVVRYGGDEFVVLMAGMPECALKGTFSRIADQIRSFNDRHAHPWILSASWGYVYVDPSDEERTFESVIEESDAKLYEEKRKKKEAEGDKPL